MSFDVPEDVADLLATRPKLAFRANLFTFELVSGPVLRYTDWRRPIVSGGHTFSPTPRLQRGTVRVERATSVSTQQITLQEANGGTIAMIAQGFFRRAIFTHERVFSPPGAVPAWTSPLTRFFGRVNAIKTTQSGAEFTVKCMLDDLDRDFPFDVIQADCSAVLFDQRCGLSRASYLVTGTASTGCTKLKLLSGLSNADDYFTQGVLLFTSGAMSGIAYLVKSYKSGVVVPAYPFLAPPASGDTFTITPGCDKTLGTCQTKYGYDPSAGTAPFFRGMPFVPDPTVTY